MTLRHGPLTLRPLMRRDAAEWAEVRQRNWQWLKPWEPTPPEGASQRPNFAQMVRNLKQQARAGQSLPFVIDLDRDAYREITEGAVNTALEGQTARVPGAPSSSRAQQLIGQLTISGITWGSAQFATGGYWIDGAVAGHSLMPTALAVATDYCFFELGLHRMELNIRPENHASRRVAEKLGFTPEGLKPRYLHIDGRWADHLGYGLGREDVPGGVLHAFQQRF